MRRGDHPTERLAIDVDLPVSCVSAAGKPSLTIPSCQMGEALIEGFIVLLLRGLDVDEAIAGVGMQSVETMPCGQSRSLWGR